VGPPAFGRASRAAERGSSPRAALLAGEPTRVLSNRRSPNHYLPSAKGALRLLASSQSEKKEI